MGGPPELDTISIPDGFITAHLIAAADITQVAIPDDYVVRSASADAVGRAVP
ncbi:MAG: hypothetical protein BWX80_03711 [Candidatus Hydrogenedentes bacterium ADurb.Bin101]|nr:MAG: hypothetical protein BWX80_03711 [Candidatus Hydrogenedentes bacterium ADurb.Bin101]